MQTPQGGDDPKGVSYFSAEVEAAYSAEINKLMRTPAFYEALGFDRPPHTVRHNTLSERVASMRLIC